MREARRHELPKGHSDAIPIRKGLRPGRHLADDLLSREQARMMLEQQLEDRVLGISGHSSTGQRYSK